MERLPSQHRKTAKRGLRSLGVAGATALALFAGACGEGNYDPALHDPGRGWMGSDAPSSPPASRPNASVSPSPEASTSARSQSPIAALRSDIAHQYESCSIN